MYKNYKKGWKSIKILPWCWLGLSYQKTHEQHPDFRKLQKDSFIPSSSSSSGAFKGHSQQSLPGFVTTKRKLSGSGIQSDLKNDWEHPLLIIILFSLSALFSLLKPDVLPSFSLLGLRICKRYFTFYPRIRLHSRQAGAANSCARISVDRWNTWLATAAWRALRRSKSRATLGEVCNDFRHRMNLHY